MKKILFSLLMLCCMTVAWAQDDGFVNVATTIQLWNAIKDNPRAKVRLTADFALSDIDKDYELYCNGNTFYGTIDGNGHTIKGDPVTSVRARTYMFYNCNGATFKNLTFKGIRVNSTKNPNQAIITATAKNGCVFENITFDNVHTWTDYDNAGSVAGWAENCTFKDITVKNSDFTVDQNQSGCVVGHAIGCTFTNIKVENCESTAAADEWPEGKFGKAGGVAGRTDDCTINNVEILGCLIKTYIQYAGGVVGYSVSTHFTNCIVDDQSCVCYCQSEQPAAFLGGIVGDATKGEIHNCINSALIASVDEYVGGIAGRAAGTLIEDCLNTGMVIKIKSSEVLGNNGYYSKYKNRQLPCVTKYYNGKEYVVRKTDSSGSVDYFGGIAGKFSSSSIYRCTNFGSINSTSSSGGIIGGIGNGDDVAIIDCLVDFDAPSGVYGISGEGGSNVTISSCLNLTGKKSYPGSEVDTGIIISYDRYLADDDLIGGQACYSLGSGWQQNFGTDPYPTPTGDKRLYHSRSITNEYGTAYLPYTIRSDENISFYTLEGDDSDDEGIKLKFKYAEKVKARTPALFRASGSPTPENPVEITIYDAHYIYDFHDKDNPINNSWSMDGFYQQRVFEGDEAKSIYYISGGKIRNANKTTIAPFRAFFHGPSIETLKGGAANIRIMIEDENGETTAISLVNENYNENENFGGKAYSLMGTEVGEGYRGIVIKNGKKYINR